MNDIKKEIDKLKDLLKSSKGPNIQECIPDLTSTVAILELLSPSIDQYKTLSRLLRGRLQPLYSAHLQATLNYAVIVLKYIHTEKIVPSLRNGDLGRANLWESPVFALISGMLDYLEEHQTKKARETVASAVYPSVCALYFTTGPGLLSSYDGNVLSNVYMLLGETVGSPGGDVGNLRNHIGSRRLGHTIAEIRNYLALESIINLLGNLIPPQKGGKEKRTKFLQEVFEEPTFKDSKAILQALETIKRDWTVTATKIIHLLAESDIRFPQPFQALCFQVESSSMTTSDPIFVDNKSFVASIDQDDSVDSLVIPFATVRKVTISALKNNQVKIELLTNKAPLLGKNPMSLPQQETYSVMRERNLRMEWPAHRKLSQAPGELLPEIVLKEDDKKWQEKAAKLTNMAKYGDSDPVDRDKFSTSSPRLGHSTSSNSGDHQDPSAFVDLSSDNAPNTVFLDPDGNFSIHPPQPLNLDREQLIATSNNLSHKDQQGASEDDEILSQPKRASESKMQTIIISDDEDEYEHPPTREVESSKKIGKTQKRLSGVVQSKALKTDDATSRQTKKLATGAMNDNYDLPKAKTNDTRKSNVDKKRPLQEDGSDMEAPTAKRVRQALEGVPQSPVPKQRLTKYSRKSQPVLIASPTDDIDFDEIPKAKQDRPQAKAKAMKGKNGKVALRPRPVTRKKDKKQDEGREAVQRKTRFAVEDADKTLVEKANQLESHKVRPSAKGTNSKTTGGNKNENTRLKKSDKAPWEVQEFASVKIEMAEEVTTGFDPTDDLLSKSEQASPDAVKNDLPLHDERLFRDVKLETTPSSKPPLSPPAPEQAAQVWIDLTNSPEPAEMTKPTPLRPAFRKTPSLDTRAHESIEEVKIPSFHLDRATKTGHRTHKTVEKVPLPPIPSEDESESVFSTPPARSAKTRSSPIRARRLPVGNRIHTSAQKFTGITVRHIEEDEVRACAMPKEQNSGLSGSNRRRLRESEDDPDLRIAAVLGEINKALIANVEKRFTGMSSDLQRMKRELKAQVAEELDKMNKELFKRYNSLVDLHERYVFHLTNLTNALDAYEKACADSAQGYRDMLRNFKRNSLRNKLPMNLVKESTLAEIKKHSKLNIEI